jgi:hypothetical protein
MAGTLTTPGELTDLTGRRGVIRLVGAGVRYDCPPIGPHIWHYALEQPGRFEMAWPAGNPADVPSLQTLASDVARDPTPARLAELDRAAETLLIVADHLHERDWRLGLVHPGNVLVVPGSGGGQLVVPDLGFVWRGSHGSPPWRDSPGRPSWIEPGPEACMWDNEPVFQQFVKPGEDDEPLPETASDLRTIARLFAALLTGQMSSTIPSYPGPAPVWALLQAVMDGQVDSAADFRERLVQTPLSGHWSTPMPPAKKGSGIPALAALLLLTGVIGGGAGALYLAGYFNPDAPPTSNAAVDPGKNDKPPSDGSPEEIPAPQPMPAIADDAWKDKPTEPPAASSSLADLWKRIQSAPPEDWAKLLRQMYGVTLSADPKEMAREMHWIEYYRGEYMRKWVDRFKKSDKVAQEKIAARLDMAKSIRELTTELNALRERSAPYTASLDELEKQCLSFSDRRATELGSSR